MGKLLIASPVPLSAVAASRGAGAANLATIDPKEVWVDSAVGTPATIDIDLGSAAWIDTIALIAVYGAAPTASWTITGGAAGYTDTTIKAAGNLRPVDAAGQYLFAVNAVWSGSPVLVRYIRISLTQPAGSPPLQIGRAMVAAAFIPTFNKEWGAGRGIIDTGSATRLPSGGIATVEGARFGTYAWTLGDLTDAEAERLYGIQREVGETLPLLVIEDHAAVAGQANRIHYGCLVSLRKFERRSPNRTRWEFTMEEWI